MRTAVQESSHWFSRVSLPVSLLRDQRSLAPVHLEVGHAPVALEVQPHAVRQHPVEEGALGTPQGLDVAAGALLLARPLLIGRVAATLDPYFNNESGLLLPRSFLLTG